MKTTLKSICLIALVALGASCAKDDPEQPIQTEGTLAVQAKVCEVTTITPPLTIGADATCAWTVEAAASETYGIANIASPSVQFVAGVAGEYKLKLAATKSGNSQTFTVTVTVGQAASTPSPYIAKIFEVLPAPGQFTNELPLYADGDTKETIAAKVADQMVGKEKSTLVSLGGFGGYITFGFDHTIVNVAGKRDLRILGNAFYANANPNPDAPKKGGSCEPGIVMVAYDRNKNGVPDPDEWYEIAGSEYHKPSTIKNYEITYYRPTTEVNDPDAGGSYVTIKNYIRWEDNQGKSGYKEKNMFHSQTYYPKWITADKMTFKGTLVANNAIDESGVGNYWVLYALGFGYVDNVPNADDDAAIDISWAVDANGAPVHLPGLDFVKVYNCLNQEAGWLGETSTEICGAYDLHLRGESILTVKK